VAALLRAVLFCWALWSSVFDCDERLVVDRNRLRRRVARLVDRAEVQHGDVRRGVDGERPRPRVLGDRVRRVLAQVDGSTSEHASHSCSRSSDSRCRQPGAPDCDCPALLSGRCSALTRSCWQRQRPRTRRWTRRPIPSWRSLDNGRRLLARQDGRVERAPVRSRVRDPSAWPASPLRMERPACSRSLGRRRPEHRDGRFLHLPGRLARSRRDQQHPGSPGERRHRIHLTVRMRRDGRSYARTAS
jgi:hypothetical protein